jgi:hypothetical protein
MTGEPTIDATQSQTMIGDKTLDECLERARKAVAKRTQEWHIITDDAAKDRIPKYHRSGKPHYGQTDACKLSGWSMLPIIDSQIESYNKARFCPILFVPPKQNSSREPYLDMEVFLT